MHCQQGCYRVLIWQRPMRAIAARSNSSVFNSFNVKASLVPKRLRRCPRNAFTMQLANVIETHKGQEQFQRVVNSGRTKLSDFLTFWGGFYSFYFLRSSRFFCKPSGQMVFPIHAARWVRHFRYRSRLDSDRAKQVSTLLTADGVGTCLNRLHQ